VGPLLGQGAQGQVYAAHDELTDDEVVVKQVHGGQEASLCGEYRLLSQLHHPNIVGVRDLLTVDEQPFMVQDRVQGLDFVRWARGTDRLVGAAPPVCALTTAEIERACLGFAATLRGLQYLHTQGVVHRDVKPDSLLVGPGQIGVLPALRVVDFGLARLAPAAETAGTLEYAAPEVKAGAPATAASDLFSLGVVVYEAVTGELPLSPDRGDELAHVPALLREILADLMHPEAAHRPTAEQLLQSLGRLLSRSLQLSAEELAGDYYPHAPLVGRDAALARLEQGMAQVARRHAQPSDRPVSAVALHLSGMGKTMVLRQACAPARLAGLEVVTASSLHGLLAVLDVHGPCSDAQRLATELVDSLLQRLKAHPVLLALDGWRDDGPVGQAFLAQLTRLLGLEAASTLVVWANDRPPTGSEVPFEQITLEPLDADQLDQVVRRMLWHLPRSAWSDWPLQTRTGGDPRLLVELVRAQIEAGLPAAVVEAPRLESLVKRRLGGLTDAQRELLAIVAHSPVPIPPTVLSAVAPDRGQLLGQLLEHGFLTLAAEGHVAVASVSLGRQARHAIPEAERPLLHQRFADAWRGSAWVRPAVVGHHLIRAGAVEQGVEQLLQASFPEEADLALAAERLPLDSPQRKQVQRRRARQARAGGDTERAMELARDQPLLQAELLLDGGQPVPALELLHGVPRTPRGTLLAARCHFLLGDYARAIAEAGHASRGSQTDVDTAVMLDNLAALSLIYTGQVEQGAHRVQHAIPLARRLDDLDPLARLLNSLGIAQQRLGRFEEAERAYTECLALSRRMGDLRFAATSALNLGTLAHHRLELATALQKYAEASALAHRAGAGTTLALALANEGNLRLMLGDLTGAEADLDTAATIATDGGAGGVLGHVQLYRGELLLARGDAAAAAGCLDEARRCFDSSDTAGQLAADLLQGEVLLQQEQPEAARSLAARLLQQMAAQEPERWRAHLLLGEACLRDGHGVDAVYQLELGLAHARRQQSEWFFLVHGLLARAHAIPDSQESPPVAGPGPERQGDQVAFHAREADRLLEQLRQRVPLEHRPSFDDSWRVQRVVRALQGLPRGAASDGPSAEQLRRLLEINKELGRQRSVELLLGRILEGAIDLTGAERGFVLIDEGKGLRVAASRNMDHESVRRGMKKFSHTIARMAMDQQRPVVAADAQDDERFGERLSIHGLKLRAVLCVPMRAGDHTRGALYVDNRFQADAFQPGHVTLMEAFADQAGIALDSARLLQESTEHREALARARDELARLNRQLEVQVSRQAQELSEITVRLRSQEEELVRRFNAANLAGRSRSMRALFLQIDRVADASVPVFIWGESGTGKELVARAIHYTGSRGARPFVTINCGAIPATLLESELFGHVRGAFTGALRDRPGLFEVAADGTLFLDEVGDMPLDMQVKLLRVLQEGTFRRLGEERERRARCRVVSASLHRLDELVAQGRFREDLYYRLNVVPLSVPPLRERREDIPILVEHLLARMEQKVSVSPAALAALVDHDWPGNVRQLENELQRAALLGGQRIEPAALSPTLHGQVPADWAQEQVPADWTLQRALADHERRLIQQALEAEDGNVTRAAARLGIHRVALHRKLQKLGLKAKRINYNGNDVSN